MDDGFNKTYDALGAGRFRWRDRFDDEQSHEYIERRDKAVRELYSKLQPSNNTGVKDNDTTD